MAEEEKVSEEQAEEALQQLLGANEGEETEEVAAEPSVLDALELDAEPVTEEAPAEEVAEPGADDLASLQERNKTLEAEGERFESRMKALQDRNVANEQILRDRYLRKSNETDKALKILEATRSEAGVSEAEVDQAIRDLRGTMNPQSPSYVAPQPVQPQANVNEDQALALNSFLNEKGMTQEEADTFGRWIQTDAATVMSQAEQNVAGQSIDGFLRLAHNHWNAGIQEKEGNGKRDDAVEAVRSVQRLQRDAAKAASGAPRAPKKQPTAQPTTIDTSKLTNDDISTLLRKSVEQYR